MIYLKYDALDKLVAIMGYALQNGLTAQARLDEFGRWEIELKE